MSMSTVKLGFIGTGGNAGWHMRDLSSLEGTRLVAFCDIVEERHKKQPRLTVVMPSDYNQMLAKEDLDAVYISIPPFAHGAPERAVIHAGLAMFVEKPVHMDTKDAREISQMVNKAGIITAAGYQERYLDIIDKAKELLKNRRIGFFMGYWMGAVCQVGGGVRRKNLGADS